MLTAVMMTVVMMATMKIMMLIMVMIMNRNYHDVECHDGAPTDVIFFFVAWR